MKKVLLINFGGPNSADEIPKFLKDLFEDPYIFDLPLPEFLRLPLGRLIASKRAGHAEKLYRKISSDGSSPLVRQTMQQASELERILRFMSKDDWEVGIAMTCGYPSLKVLTPKDLTPSADSILFPLFPQFSRSTVLSAAGIIEKITGKNPNDSPGWIPAFYQDHSYLEAISCLIVDFCNGIWTGDFQNETDSGVPDWTRTDILFSAHGIPERLVRKGDPYPDQLQVNMEGIVSRLREKGYEGNAHLCYQSKVGPLKWLGPSTQEALKNISREGKKQVIIYPISFVCDHLETLEEIDIEFRAFAKSIGIEGFHRVPAPGSYSLFIRFMAEAVLREAGRFAGKS